MRFGRSPSPPIALQDWRGAGVPRTQGIGGGGQAALGPDPHLGYSMLLMTKAWNPQINTVLDEHVSVRTRSPTKDIAGEFLPDSSLSSCFPGTHPAMSNSLPLNLPRSTNLLRK